MDHLNVQNMILYSSPRIKDSQTTKQFQVIMTNKQQKQSEFTEKNQNQYSHLIESDQIKNKYQQTYQSAQCNPFLIKQNNENIDNVIDLLTKHPKKRIQLEIISLTEFFSKLIYFRAKESKIDQQNTLQNKSILQFSKQAQYQFVPKGEKLFTNGNFKRQFYLILSGTASLLLLNLIPSQYNFNKQYKFNIKDYSKLNILFNQLKEKSISSKSKSYAKQIKTQEQSNPEGNNINQPLQPSQTNFNLDSNKQQDQVRQYYQLTDNIKQFNSILAKQSKQDANNCYKFYSFTNPADDEALSRTKLNYLNNQSFEQNSLNSCFQEQEEREKQQQAKVCATNCDEDQSQIISDCFSNLNLNQIKNVSEYFEGNQFKYIHGKFYNTGESIQPPSLKTDVDRKDCIVAITDLHVAWLSFKEYMLILNSDDQIQVLKQESQITDIFDEENKKKFGNIFYQLVPFLQQKQYSPRQKIFSEDQNVDGVFIILQGEIELIRNIQLNNSNSLTTDNILKQNANKNFNYTISVQGKGQYFGEDEIIKKQEKRLFTAQCKNNVRVYFIKKDHFIKFISQSINLLDFFFDRVQNKQQRQEQEVEEISKVIQNDYENTYQNIQNLYILQNNHTLFKTSDYQKHIAKKDQINDKQVINQYINKQIINQSFNNIQDKQTQLENNQHENKCIMLNSNLQQKLQENIMQTNNLNIQQHIEKEFINNNENNQSSLKNKTQQSNTFHQTMHTIHNDDTDFNRNYALKQIKMEFLTEKNVKQKQYFKIKSTRKKMNQNNDFSLNKFSKQNQNIFQTSQSLEQEQYKQVNNSQIQTEDSYQIIQKQQTLDNIYQKDIQIGNKMSHIISKETKNILDRQKTIINEKDPQQIQILEIFQKIKQQINEDSLKNASSSQTTKHINIQQYPQDYQFAYVQQFFASQQKLIKQQGKIFNILKNTKQSNNSTQFLNKSSEQLQWIQPFTHNTDSQETKQDSKQIIQKNDGEIIKSPTQDYYQINPIENNGFIKTTLYYYNGISSNTNNDKNINDNSNLYLKKKCLEYKSEKKNDQILIKKLNLVDLQSIQQNNQFNDSQNNVQQFLPLYNRLQNNNSSLLQMLRSQSEHDHKLLIFQKDQDKQKKILNNLLRSPSQRKLKNSKLKFINNIKKQQYLTNNQDQIEQYQNNSKKV